MAYSTQGTYQNSCILVCTHASRQFLKSCAQQPTPPHPRTVSLVTLQSSVLQACQVDLKQLTTAYICWCCHSKASTQCEHKQLTYCDMCVAGYLPSSGGLRSLQARLSRGDSRSPLVNEAPPSPELMNDSYPQTNGSAPVPRTSAARSPKVNLLGCSCIALFRSCDGASAICTAVIFFCLPLACKS